jgi:hypothetical protein
MNTTSKLSILLESFTCIFNNMLMRSIRFYTLVSTYYYYYYSSIKVHLALG